MNIKQSIIALINKEIQQRQELLAKVEAAEIGDCELEGEPTVYSSGQIDFDRLSHPEVIKVIQAIPGKWDKEPSSEGTRINYSTKRGDLTFRCWAGEPPPNCKIVELLVTIPAQPETVRTVRKLQCV